MYSVNEGMGVEICIITFDNVMVPVLVNVSLVGGTAQSEFLFPCTYLHLYMFL